MVKREPSKLTSSVRFRYPAPTYTTAYMLTFNIRSHYRSFYPYAYWDNFFTDDELTKIEDYCDEQGYEKGIVGSTKSDTRLDETVRKSKMKFHYYNNDTAWIFNKLRTLVDMANNEFYKFDLWGFDHFQYTIYDEIGCKYDTHCDIMYGDELTINNIPQRKLSFSILISDPDTYEGGDFEIVPGKSALPVESKKGRAIIFPSFIPHRVTPLRMGIRKSLVVWAVGPRFK